MDTLTRTVIEVAARHAPDERAAALEADEAFADAGVDSLALVALVVDLEQMFAVQFPAELMNADTFRTPRSVAEAMRALRGEV